jgi:hypothetical protein
MPTAPSRHDEAIKIIKIIKIIKECAAGGGGSSGPLALPATSHPVRQNLPATHGWQHSRHGLRATEVPGDRPHRCAGNRLRPELPATRPGLATAAPPGPDGYRIDVVIGRDAVARQRAITTHLAPR